MRLLVAVGLVALVFPGAAFAHANLTETTPGFRERLEAAPPAVVVRFNEAVKVLAPDAIEVRAASGRLVSGPAELGEDPHFVEAPLRHLAKGAYTVRWRALSPDGHLLSGVYTFGVRQPAPPPTEAYGASGPTTAEHVVRWGYFAALALLVGGLGFRLLVLRGPLPARLERRFYAVTGIGAVGVLEAGITAFLLRAGDAIQLPFGEFLYSDLQSIAEGTRFGRAFIAMTLGFALVAALLFLAWLSDRPAPLWPAFLLGLGLTSGLSLSGHSATGPRSSSASELADWVHLSAATLWVGGLVQLLLVVWPAAPELRRRAFVRFSRLATGLIALLLGAGIYLSVLRLPQLQDLWSEGYGQVLLVKLGLVTVALVWGALHHFLVPPALEQPGGEGLLVRVRRSLLGEAAVGMAILLIAAVLVDSKPPPEPATQPAQATSPGVAQGQPPPAAIRWSGVLPTGKLPRLSRPVVDGVRGRVDGLPGIGWAQAGFSPVSSSSLGSRDRRGLRPRASRSANCSLASLMHSGLMYESACSSWTSSG